MSHKNIFGQTLVALVTPMTADGEVDWADTEKLIDYVISNGADGVVVTGTTGETSTLTDATHDRFREAGRRYGTGAGEMTVCKVIEDDAGIDLRVAGDWVKPWEVTHNG